MNREVNIESPSILPKINSHLDDCRLSSPQVIASYAELMGDNPVYNGSRMVLTCFCPQSTDSSDLYAPPLPDPAED